MPANPPDFVDVPDLQELLEDHPDQRIILPAIEGIRPRQKNNNLELETLNQRFSGSYVLIKKEGKREVVYIEEISLDEEKKTKYSLYVRNVSSNTGQLSVRTKRQFEEAFIEKTTNKPGLYNVNQNAIYLFRYAERQFIRGFNKQTFGWTPLGGIFYPPQNAENDSEYSFTLEHSEYSQKLLNPLKTFFSLIARDCFLQTKRPAVLSAINTLRNSNTIFSIAVHLRYGICLSPNMEHEFVVFKEALPVSFMDYENKTIYLIPNPNFKQEVSDFVRDRIPDDQRVVIHG